MKKNNNNSTVLYKRNKIKNYCKILYLKTFKQCLYICFNKL